MVLSFVIGLSACTLAIPSAVPETAAGQADYPDLGIAPELSGISWLNTPIPLRLADLRGKVILLDMWTFG